MFESESKRNMKTEPTEHKEIWRLSFVLKGGWTIYL